MKKAIACLVVAMAPAVAQDIKFPASFEKLAAKAKETVDVTLDSSMLQLAGKFLSSQDTEEAKAHKLVNGLKGIYVRSFQFEKEGEYTDADLEAVRSQLNGPGWTRLVTVRSKKDGDNADIFMKKDGERISGMVVVAAEPRELTVVNIVGPINLEDLGSLAGQFGVPKVNVDRKPMKKAETK